MFNSNIRTYSELCKERQDDEGLETSTTIEQKKVEKDVLELYQITREPVLARSKNISFLKKSLTYLTEPYECLDCSRPWLCFWILHSLQILGERPDEEDYSKIIGFLDKCQSPDGGFGGGPGQHPHLASTYASVNALCIIGTTEAYRTINRKGLQRFLMTLRDDEGAFSMHVGGEVDIRGVYCAIVVAKITNVFTSELFRGTEEWVAKCQTWEGGFGGCPGMEAHGGYAFCGLASLMLLGRTDLIQLPSLLRWMVNKQMRLEGGFQGRTNKLVDGCYSFWQGGAFPLVHAILTKREKVFNQNTWLFNQEALQEYILICCQHPFGGLLDKPAKNRDIYHTCYALSGLSIAQNSPQPIIIGSRYTNAVEVTHPVYNLVLTAATDARNYFDALPIPD